MNRRTDRLDGRIGSARGGDARRGAQRDAAAVLRIACWAVLALAAGCASEPAGAPRSADTPARGVAVSAPVALGAAIDRVRFAFRVEGDGWSGGHERYGVHVTTSALSITPFLHEGSTAPGAPERVVAGAPASFEAAAVTRGGVALASGRGDGRIQSDGHLAVARGEVWEESENRADGVEQRWSFARRPAGVGDLNVRVMVAGEPFTGETASGLHFRDARTGLGVRYGHGTWVDAAGARTRVPARWDGRAIVLSVPSAVADAATYPAVLDPLISPEFGVDRAPPGPASGGEPALASDGHEFLLVWREGRAIVAGWIGPDGRALADGNVVLSVNQNALGQPVLNSAPVVASNGRGFLVAWKAQRYTGSAQRYEVHAARVDRERGVLDPGNLDLAGVQLGPISAIDVASNGRDYLVAWGRSNPAVAFFATVVSAEDAAIATVPLGGGDLRVAPHVASDGRDYLVTRGAQGARVGAAGALLDPGGIALPGGDAVAFDGHDYVVAWSEERGASGGDLFVAHVSTDGVVREPEGVAVSTAPNEQFAPRLSYDGRDVVVAWTDARASAACDPCALDPSSCSPCLCNAACSRAYTTTALYAARLTRAGLVRDPEGIAVTAPAPAPGARSLTLASNDAATLLAWEGPPRADADGPRTIYGVRLSRSGVLRELPDPVLAHATNDQRAPAVAGDDDGGFLVVWQDYRNRAPAGLPPTFSWDVIGARVGAFGAFGRPVVISEAAGDQVAPAVTFDRGRYLVAWQDRRGGSWDIYGARVTRGGVVRDPAGIALAAAPGDQTAPAAAGAMVLWSDASDTGTAAIRGTRLSLAGAALDPAGLPISQGVGLEVSPAIAVERDGYRVAWASAGSSPGRVATAHVDGAGAVRDTTWVPVAGRSHDEAPSVACGVSGCLVAWSRVDPTRPAGGHGSVAEIYGARLGPEGALPPPTPIAPVFPFDPSAYRFPRLAPDGDGYLVVWEVVHERVSNGASASYEVLASRVPAGGVSPAEAFAVAADGVGAYAPVVAANPGGPAIVVYLRSELGAAATAPARVVARLLTPGADCAGGACPGASCIPGFDDCDGVATNGCEASLRADPANCGGCGIRCAIDHGTAACAVGRCAVASCLEGFADCDQRADNGCEMDLAAAPIRGTLRLPLDTVRGTFPASPTGVDFEPTGSSFTYCQRPHGGEHAHLFRLRVTERIGVELDSDPGSGPGRRTLKTIALRRACNGPASEFACEDWGDSDGDTYGYRPLLARVLDPGEYVVALDGPASSDYALALRTFTPPLSADCATAPELVPGVFATGDTARGGRPATACYASAIRPQHFYAVTIPPHDRAILNIGTGEYDTGIVLRAYEACGAPDCLASSSSGDVPLRSPNRYAALGLDNPADAPRRVIVGVSATPDAVSEATFSLGVTFAPLPTTEAPNASCDRATSVGDGTHLLGEDSRLATSAATCDTEALQGRVLYYRVTVPAGRVLVVRARSTGSPAIAQQVRVLDACGATTCLASLSIGASSLPPVLRHLNASETPRTWILAVGDAYASAGRLFDLDVSIESLLAAAPRPVAPLSTATVTSRRPWLRWALGGGFDGARVEVCRDRPCSTVVATFDAVGTGGAPAADLPAGVLFWRTRGRVGASTGTAVSPTWEFTVGARSAPVDTSWGTTLDVDGDGYADVLVGAGAVNSNEGRAYVYRGGAMGLTAALPATLGGPVGVHGGFGYSVASAGDVNGDGYGDVISGANEDDASTGSASIFLGGASGVSLLSATTLRGLDGPNGSAGRSVAGAGDVNGDGYADVVVGADSALMRTGRAYVFLGGGSGVGATPATVLTGPDGADGYFGWSTAGAGDVNGDGYADVIVGAVAFSPFGGGTNPGHAYVFHGGPTGLSSTPMTVLTVASSANSLFGGSVASAGDVNGDGYADVIVGASGVFAGNGAAYLYLGGASGVSVTPLATLVGTEGAGSEYAISVTGAGDVNSDGYADVLVGASSALGGVGRAFLFLGSGTTFALTPATTLTGPDGAGSYFGRSVAAAGDVNRDGFADVIVGAPGVDRAYLFLGGATGLGSTPTITLTSPAGQDAFFGASVASAAAVPPGRPRDHHSSPTSLPVSAGPRRSRAFRCCGRVGLSYAAIADQISAEGHPSKRGGRWLPNTVRRDWLRTS